MALKPTTVPTKRLAATISASATAIQLNNIEGWNGSDLTASDFGTALYAVLRNDANTLMELIELDPATIASTSITILRRGLQFDGNLTTEVTANKRTWVKNETLVELGADSPQLFQWFKEYIDSAVVSGGVPATTTVAGIVELATQAQMDAGTSTGETGKSLAPTPALIRAKKYHDYAADAGSTDAYAITVTPAPTAYAVGQVFVFKANTANTGAATLNVNSLGAITIKKNVSTELSTNDILANQIVAVTYDGTNFQMVSTVPTQLTADVQTFTASGTWTKPVSGTIAEIEMWGAGGGGGRGSVLGGGGGAGGYKRELVPLSALGATETVTIGAGGAGATSNNTNGSAGGNTTFGSWFTAYAGGGGSGSAGTDGDGGGGGGWLGAGGTSSTDPGTAGAPADGNLHGGTLGGAASATTGSAGGAGYYGGGGGGGSAENDGGSTSAGGAGGASVYGGGGGGGTGFTTAAPGGTSKFGGAGGDGGVGATSTGSNGVAPAGGGGGGRAGNGGNGADGKVRVTVW